MLRGAEPKGGFLITNTSDAWRGGLPRPPLLSLMNVQVIKREAGYYSTLYVCITTCYSNQEPLSVGLLVRRAGVLLNGRLPPVEPTGAVVGAMGTGLPHYVPLRIIRVINLMVTNLHHAAVPSLGKEGGSELFLFTVNQKATTALFAEAPPTSCGG